MTPRFHLGPVRFRGKLQPLLGKTETVTYLPTDGTAGSWIVALISRPHDPKLATKVIDDLARHCFYISSGSEHPEFPRRNKRSADNLDGPTRRLIGDFRRGLRAGERFDAALLQGILKIPSAVDIPHHVASAVETALSSLNHISGNARNVRRHYWQRYMPYLHLAAAMSPVATKLGWKDLSHDPDVEIETLRRIIFEPPEWMANLLRSAEQKRALAHWLKVGNPERMERIAQE